MSALPLSAKAVWRPLRATEIRIIDNWPDVLKRAWSVRILAIAGILSGAEAVLPLYSDRFPPNVFASLLFVTIGAALIAPLWRNNQRIKPMKSRYLQTGAAGLALLAAATAYTGSWEGTRYVPYYDVGLVLTVCRGHTGITNIVSR
ncbi:hypothetical protein [Mesorhizobium sp. M0047]|uniref:DUF7940 domain-containing protein n=1 Tax=Mesorhizobium sp. M0047 TaxID=2956859 RepID=UPI00333D2EB5